MEDRDHKSRGRSARDERIHPEDRSTRVNPTEVGKELATIDTGIDQDADKQGNRHAGLWADVPEDGQKEQPASQGGREECRDLDVVGR